MNTDEKLIRKKRHAEKIINEIIPLLKEQFTSFETIAKKRDDFVSLYFVEQNRSLIEDLEMIEFMLKNKKEHYSAAIVRICMNKIIKLLYLTYLDEAKQENYVRKDFMEMARKLYLLSQPVKSKQIFKENFDFFCTDDYKNADISTLKRIISFPHMHVMLDKVYSAEPRLKAVYEDLSEFAHGNILFAIRNNQQKDDFASILLMGRLAIDLFKLNDWHLNGGNTSEKAKSFIEENKKLIDEIDKS